MGESAHTYRETPTLAVEKFALISASALGDNTIVAAVAGKKIKVTQYVMVATAAVAPRWKSGASNNLSGAMSLAANGIISTPGGKVLMETVAGEALVLNLSSAVAVNGHLVYIEEA